MRLVPYAQWSTRSRGATSSSHPIGATKGVSLHWEGPHMGAFPHDACDDKVRSIQGFHRDTRGWADIAYNGIVCPHGYIYEGRGPNTTSAANGDTQPNDDWYAVCYLGGERDGFTDEGKQGFHDAVHWLRDKGSAGPAVNGHRDHKATACPGDEIYAWLHSHDFSSNPDQEDDMPAYRDWDQADKDALANDIRKALQPGEQSRFQRLRDKVKEIANAERQRDKALADKLDSAADA